jgi:hypothetical protein
MPSSNKEPFPKTNILTDDGYECDIRKTPLSSFLKQMESTFLGNIYKVVANQPEKLRLG